MFIHANPLNISWKMSILTKESNKPWRVPVDKPELTRTHKKMVKTGVRRLNG